MSATLTEPAPALSTAGGAPLVHIEDPGRHGFTLCGARIKKYRYDYWAADCAVCVVLDGGRTGERTAPL